MTGTKTELLNTLDATNNNFLFGFMSFWVTEEKRHEMDWGDGLFILVRPDGSSHKIELKPLIDIIAKPCLELRLLTYIFLQYCTFSHL